MYRRSPSRERERDHTEFQLSLITSVSHSRALPRGIFEDLLEVRETRVQPEATIERESTQEAVSTGLFVVEGSIEVTDAEGRKVRLEAGKVAVLKLSPGLAVYLHNPSESEVSRVVEIWTSEGADEPVSVERIEVRDFEPKEARGTLLPIASGQSHPQAIALEKDLAIYQSRLYPPEQLIFETLPERSTFLFLIDGHLRVGEERMHSGDGLAIWRESLVSIAAQDRSEFILVDLPPNPREWKDDR